MSAMRAPRLCDHWVGDAATFLMALGWVGTGLLAVPILTGSAAYAICEIFGWNATLDAKPGKAKGFYLALGASTVEGTVLALIGVNPMNALFWTAAVNGFLSPPLLVFILLIANDKHVMGDWVNGKVLNLLGWGTTAP